MKLQFTETITTGDPEVVLQTLEACLQGVALEVVRSGDELTAYGIGPSFRAKNHKDKAVLQIRHEQGATVVYGDAIFQASGLLGEAPQDGIVRSKFATVFECAKDQLKSLHVAPLPPAPVLVEQTVLETEHSESQSAAASESPTLTAPSPVAPEPEGIAEPASRMLPVAEAPAMSKFTRSEEAPPDSRAPRLVFAALLALSLLLIPALWPELSSILRHRQHASDATPHDAGDRTPQAIAAPGVQPAQSAGETAAAPAPTPAIAPSPSTPSATPTPQSSTAAVPDPDLPEGVSARQRIEDWGAALRTRDAAAQAAFYSSRVHPYLGNLDVDRDFVLHDKQTAIQSRQGLWTIKLEDVQVEPETSSTAKVSLIKHVIDQPTPSRIVERSIDSRLHLRRVDGQWYITSERDLP